VIFGAVAATWACNVSNNVAVPAGGRPVSPTSRWGTSAVFTSAHATASSAVRDFFGIRPEPVQPFDFSHQIHLAKELLCTDCHTGVEKGPVAGLPSVSTCMICHSQIATDRPLIQQLTQLSEKGIDLQWQRVYGYVRESHVRFDHAPHIRAKVDCATCHGNLAEQTVARRVVDQSMQFCVSCHRSKQASNDCQTCHY
jgi:hypothetical protein